MRTTNGLSWAWLGAFFLGASCAQGSSDNGVDPGTVVGLDGGTSSSDSGAGTLPSDDASGSGGGSSDDAGTGEETGGGGSGGGSGSRSGAAGSRSGSSSSGSSSSSSGSSSGSASSSGSSSGSSSSSSGSSSGGTVPTTCAQAAETYGCCVGNTVYFCKSGSSSITVKACTGTEACGWDSTKSYYYCVAAPGGADPSGNYPLTCQ